MVSSVQRKGLQCSTNRLHRTAIVLRLRGTPLQYPGGTAKETRQTPGCGPCGQGMTGRLLTLNNRVDVWATDLTAQFP